MSYAGTGHTGKIMGWLRSLMRTRVAEQLSLVLLTAGGVLSVFAWLRLACTLPLVLVISILSVFAVWLFTRRAWVFAAALGVTAVGYGILRLVMLLPAAAVEIEAWGERFAAYAWEYNLLYIAAAALVLACALFAYVRRALLLPFAVAALGVLCAGAVVLLQVMRLAQRTEVLVLLAGGFLILLPAAYYRRMKQTGGENTVTLSAL
ncbi:MAG: hypothetical protein ACERKO_02895, partial [Acetanaerobacterium sp.]